VFQNLPWEVLLDNVPTIITVDIALLVAVAFLYLYRLDRIPHLWIPGAVGILLVMRALDTATFFLVAGAEYAAAEINPLYQILALYLPSFWAIITVQIGVTIYMGIGLWMLLVGRISRRVWLTLVAVFSAMSLFGAATNVLASLGLW